MKLSFSEVVEVYANLDEPQKAAFECLLRLLRLTQQKINGKDDKSKNDKVEQ